MNAHLYSATVTYRDGDGRQHEESFPVGAHDHTMATEMALAYVLQILRIREFELRVVGG